MFVLITLVLTLEVIWSSLFLSYLYLLLLLFFTYSDYFDKLASIGHVLFPSCGTMDEDV